MEYPVIRSKRKTVAIVVSRDGSVEIRAPQRLPLREIEAFVKLKENWIAQKSLRLHTQAEARKQFCLRPGDTTPLLGQEYPILVGARASFDGEAFFVRPGKEPRLELPSIYRELARESLTRRVTLYAGRMGVAPAGLRITSASTRYGSCSGKNSISFTWKLIMAPPELVDYVVVHELCHLRQHNHSARFWAEVNAQLPDFREREAGLKEFGRMLALQKWE